MTIRVNYIGTSDRRVISRRDVVSAGLADPGGDLIWRRSNNYKVDLPNEYAAFMLSQGDFRIEEGFRFGDFLADAPERRLVRAEINPTKGVWTDVDTESDFVIPYILPYQWLCIMPDLAAGAGKRINLDMWTVVDGIALHQFSDFDDEGTLGWTLHAADFIHVGTPAWYQVQESDVVENSLRLRLRAFSEDDRPRSLKGVLVCLGPFGDGAFPKTDDEIKMEAITAESERLHAQAREVLEESGIEVTAEAIEWLVMVKGNPSLRKLEGVDIQALLRTLEYLKREEEAELRRQVIEELEAEEERRGLPHKDRSNKGKASADKD